MNKQIAIEAADIETVLAAHGITEYTLPDDDAEATEATVTEAQMKALTADDRVTYISEL